MAREVAAITSIVDARLVLKLKYGVMVLVRVAERLRGYGRRAVATRKCSSRIDELPRITLSTEEPVAFMTSHQRRRKK